MELVPQEQTVFTVNLHKAELEYIVEMTQNYCGPNPETETEKEKAQRMKLFVGANRVLGRQINDDGSMIRQSKGIGGFGG